jgi:DNA repair photolyase
MFATLARLVVWESGMEQATDAPSTMPARQRVRWTPLEDETVLPGFQERFTHPEFAGMEFVHVRAKSLLNHVPAAAVLPFKWTINVYRGCSHACSYCFARPTHAWLELDPDRDFERVIVVKVNAVERLRVELRRPSWRGEHVALGTNTDPYQRAEGRYRLTRGVVATLAEAGNPFSVLTKGTLVTRDLDILAEAARRGVCTGVSLSIPTVDEDVWRLTESGAPHPAARLQTVAALRDAGIPSGVMLAPIVPGLSDHEAQLRAAIGGALDAGATAITPIVLHLRPGVREVFLPRLRAEHPELADRLAATYRGANAPADVRRRIVGTVRRIVDELGGPRRSARHVDDGIGGGRRHDTHVLRPRGPDEPRPRVDPGPVPAGAMGGEQLTLL